eukprot:CAMPEP_0177450218 /NCGR_PEP_ID=MMETSP0369-20130122/9130_1 /TAXON_ID=447022 ORGANISM="Scrippsiella hangoei-like, Strain SHHI-4" /NCGR_SAMPLE_ID=MMETSP0369 /ASSEMBLY_ACC=CAM_ASM_000364 /LENGTH=185 /DNA_ID=CAMNT_0018922755 /DNA_START=17 /DNA_END=572 /DNA_ORIENTATION=-
MTMRACVGPLLLDVGFVRVVVDGAVAQCQAAEIPAPALYLGGARVHLVDVVRESMARKGGYLVLVHDLAGRDLHDLPMHKTLPREDALAVHRGVGDTSPRAGMCDGFTYVQGSIVLTLGAQVLQQADVWFPQLRGRIADHIPACRDLGHSCENHPMRPIPLFAVPHQIGLQTSVRSVGIQHAPAK